MDSSPPACPWDRFLSETSRQRKDCCKHRTSTTVTHATRILGERGQSWPSWVSDTVKGVQNGRAIAARLKINKVGHVAEAMPSGRESPDPGAINKLGCATTEAMVVISSMTTWAGGLLPTTVNSKIAALLPPCWPQVCRH